MTNKFLQGAVLVGAIATLGLLPTAPASALTFGFQNIFPINNASEDDGDSFAGDFFVDVTDNGSNSVLFKFLNQASPSTATRFIGDVYFQASNSLLSNIGRNVNNIGGVDFRSHNGNLPQGNKIGFVENANFSSKFRGGASNGVQTGEVLGISFDGSYNDVIGAIKNGSLRMGIHVQSIDGNGGSDSYVNNPNPVPTPALLPGLIAMGAGVWRKRKAEQAAEAEAEA